MVGLLSRIEGWLQGAVEGGSRAIFRQRLQPIELAKAAAREMQRHRLIGPDGVEVPNVFAIAIHPVDYAEVEPYRAALETRIARYLTVFAEERSLAPIGAVTVSLIANPAVRRRAVRVDARMADPEGGPATRPVAPVAQTELLPRIQREPAKTAIPDRLVLVLEDGRHVAVTDLPIRIGRALDNDIVIADSRVSRYHVQIATDAHGPFVRDLGSTNGTAVSGRTVSEDRLAEGDRLVLGGYQIDIRADPTGGRAAPTSRR